MIINVPKYDKTGFKFEWDDGFVIKCSISNNAILIEANREGLISLARHLLELSQEHVPEYTHLHLDEFNSLEDNSNELIIVKKDM